MLNRFNRQAIVLNLQDNILDSLSLATELVMSWIKCTPVYTFFTSSSNSEIKVAKDLYTYFFKSSSAEKFMRATYIAHISS